MIQTLLKKYRKDVSMKKTNLYQSIDFSLLKKNGIKYTCNDVIDLFQLEIVQKGLETKLKIEACYHDFVSKNYDLFEYINYEEKRKMFEVDVSQVLQDRPYFTDVHSNINIYIPYLEDFINRRYQEDYEMLTLKKQKEYLENYKKDSKNIITLYGIQPYASNLSSLQAIGKDEGNVYFYHNDFYTIYVFDLNTGSFKDEIYFVDKYSKCNPTIEEVKNWMQFYLSCQDDVEILEYLFQQGYLVSKVYRKLLRKVKK